MLHARSPPFWQGQVGSLKLDLQHSRVLWDAADVCVCMCVCAQLRRRNLANGLCTIFSFQLTLSIESVSFACEALWMAVKRLRMAAATEGA